MSGSFYSRVSTIRPAVSRMPDCEVRNFSGLPTFKLLNLFNNGLESRLGRLSCPGRQLMETPHYIAISSRGAVPHLSQDTMRESTLIKGLYAGLEDCTLYQRLAPTSLA